MLRRILLPVDVREGDVWSKAAEVAVGLARESNAELVVLFAAPKLERNLNRVPEDYQPDLDAWAAAQVPGDVRVRTLLKSGPAHRQICAAAKELAVDLVVMGSHDPRVPDTLLGSNASFVALHAPTSVYIVR